jgi:hypothetical protein
MKEENMRMKRAITVLSLLLLVLVATEVGIRLRGAVDFPIYLVDEQIRYQVQPNQSGAFLRKNTWVFNDRAMGGCDFVGSVEAPKHLADRQQRPDGRQSL